MEKSPPPHQKKSSCSSDVHFVSARKYIAWAQKLRERRELKQTFSTVYTIGLLSCRCCILETEKYDKNLIIKRNKVLLQISFRSITQSCIVATTVFKDTAWQKWKKYLRLAWHILVYSISFHTFLYRYLKLS